MRFTLIMFIILSAAMVRAQGQSTTNVKYDIGIGYGLDYGGIGVRGTIRPTPVVGLFGAAGYNLNALGWNVGAQVLLPAKKNYFFLTGMYGYNTVLIVEGTINDKGTYYGLSGGIGYQFLSHDGSKFLNIELLVPVRNSNYEEDVRTLKAMGAQISSPAPVLFSVGYHFRN